ncbi:Protein kinase domain [Legionella lansingensis]|uniref:Protein kinase domain protein n=1 Tax=Legionella lansingensis TaxID=45067 RepID=A0A0W0VQ11_9GAMM|nr:serine/threonine-protein kinase [Legionella lansingensis]KTD22231.1 Protein kinase domain protein [Legionella lansingensis]SNV55173.1 Protein kinase domain [Legionella lansingensis]
MVEVTGTKEVALILFPVKQRDGKIIYYCSDFSEDLGSGNAGDVYKGYRCDLKGPNGFLQPCEINKSAIVIAENAPSVAIKVYKNGQIPSLYRLTRGTALFTIDDRAVLIMPLIDGFDIKPDIEENPQIKNMTFFQAVDVVWQLVIGLNQLHYRNSSGPPVVHGDINGANVKIRMVNEKFEVFYLDDDYYKPILPIPQIPQGTLEHLALEVLDGYYSEASDFYALTPLLYSLFGARNPFTKIFKFRDDHPLMDKEDLVRHFTAIGFCSEGLFQHFKIKPNDAICDLLEQFLKRMSAREKEQRASSGAILEFFTALRQWCLHENPKEAEYYHLRLAIAANDTSWLTNHEQRNLFFSLEDNIQERLIHLMNFQVRMQLFHQITQLSLSLKSVSYQQLLKTLLLDIARQRQANPPSCFSSIFKSKVTGKELTWLLYCFEHDSAEFFSPHAAKFRKTLQACNDKEIGSLIFGVIETMQKNALESQKVTSALS